MRHSLDDILTAMPASLRKAYDGASADQKQALLTNVDQILVRLAERTERRLALKAASIPTAGTSEAFQATLKAHQVKGRGMGAAIHLAAARDREGYNAWCRAGQPGKVKETTATGSSTRSYFSSRIKVK